MDSLHAYLGRTSSLWDNYDYSDKQSVNVSEIWREQRIDPNRKEHHTKHHNISRDAIDSWLKTSRSEDKPDKGTSSSQECLLRVVWVPVLTEQRCWDIASDTLKRVTRCFDQEEARESFVSSFAGVVNLPRSSTGTDSAYLCMNPKLAVTWSRQSDAVLTNVVCMADLRTITAMKALLDCGFMQTLSIYYMLPPLLAAVVCNQQINNDLLVIKEQVREVEVRTGHHSWKSRVEPPARGDLFSLSAKMSGCRTRIASAVRKMEVLAVINQFIIKDRALQQQRDGHEDEVSATLRSYVETLQQSATMQRIDADFVQSRVQTQLNALFHLVAENDALINHEMAKDSRLLATASQRDASSMKSLAVVTMFFLPGTFVSSLFSMPLFDWGSGDSVSIASDNMWRGRLGLYLAVTVPLTLLTFTVWGFWMWLQTLQNRRRNQVAQMQLSCEVHMPESGALARRWTELSPGQAFDLHQQSPT